MSDVVIRTASIYDAPELLGIYQYYVLNTAITFETEVPSIAVFKERINNTLKRYPYFVALINNKIVGYCYAGAFVDREAYDYSAEVSVYIHRDFHKRGIGKLFYEKLESTLKMMGINNLYAKISSPVGKDKYLDDNSVRFHEYLGFKTVGQYTKCGYKFNRWYNMVEMEKIIGRHEKNPKKLKKFKEIY